MAVNVTLVPEHMAPLGFAEMPTLAAALEFTVIVMLFEVAGEPVAHVRLEFMTQVITSLLVKVDDV